MNTSEQVFPTCTIRCVLKAIIIFICCCLSVSANNAKTIESNPEIVLTVIYSQETQTSNMILRTSGFANSETENDVCYGSNGKTYKFNTFYAVDENIPELTYSYINWKASKLDKISETDSNNITPGYELYTKTYEVRLDETPNIALRYPPVFDVLSTLILTFSRTEKEGELSEPYLTKFTCDLSDCYLDVGGILYAPGEEWYEQDIGNLNN